ncbi:MAG: HlyD family efflux transporter periplasmic adaptor subunit [Bdellovibrionales bacterium]|nr:HlyD family efflux transporter periplasmic adaptor subunit [Bdellovibrionales bacterium]
MIPHDTFQHLESVHSRAIEFDRTRAYEKRLGRRIWIGWGVFAFALAVLPWQQTAPGVGRVIAYDPNEREQEINATVDGIVKQWFVREGSFVKAGDPIVELSDNDPAIIDRLEVERKALYQRLKASESAAETTKLNLDRQRKLFQEGLSSKREFEQAQVEYTRYIVDAANAGAELARLEVRISRQMTQKITAPVNGTILRVVAGQGGRVVKSGQMLALLVPETASRAVELWINGNDVALVREGSEVRLQFEGWPAIQFSGWPSVAVGTFPGIVSFIDPSDASTGKFRVVVGPKEGSPWPEGRHLRQGIRTIGWIQLSRVSLGFEVWRQLNGFPPSVGNPPKLSDKEPKKNGK